MGIILLNYKQREKKPLKVIRRFGLLSFESQKGFIDYDQQEEVESDKVDKRIEELKSFSNRNYHTFSICGLSKF